MKDMLITSGVAWIVLAIVLGMTFGSFGNVLVARLPKGQSILGRSRCPKCHHILAARDLVPVFSYLFLRRRCRYCGHPIALIYILTEVVAAALFVFAFTVSSAPLPAIILSFILWLLLLVSLTDYSTQTIPDALSIPLIVLAAAYTTSTRGIDITGMLLPPLFFAVQWILSRGKWVGSGDILIAAASGFLIADLKKSLLMLGLSYIIGAVFCIVMLVRGRANRKSAIAFGPFLAIATVIVMFFGDSIMRVLLRY